MGNSTRGRRLVTTIAALSLVGALTVVTSTAVEVASPTLRPAAAAPVAGGLGFTALAAPCRAVDTRSGGGVLSAGATRSFQVGGTGSLAAQGGSAAGCGVPDGAGAVEIAVTAVAPAGNGYLRAFPAGDPVPNATFINYTSGTGITNTGTVPLAATGTKDLSIANFVGSTQVVIDVLGYFTTDPVADDFQPLTPCRAVDTRVAGGPLTTGAGASRNFRVGGTGSMAAQGGTTSANGCNVPDSAAAAVVSVTAVGPVGTGFLRGGPNTGSAPAATVVNYTGAINMTNTGAMRLGAVSANDITIQNFGTSTHVVVDVVGYYTAAGGGSRYQTITPCRAVDTRFAPGGRMPADTTRHFQVASERNAFAAQGTSAVTGCGVPPRAAAVAVAVTAVNPAGNGFARVDPVGSPGNGTFLNFTTGRSVTNTGAVALGIAGLKDLAVRNVVAASDYVVDVLGYYDATRNLTAPSPAGDVAVGGRHACRLAAFGTVECWGENSGGELGSMRLGRNRTWPAPALGLFGATAVATGSDHTCALMSGGTVRCWGENSAGQLGDGGTVGRGTAAAVTGISSAVQVVAGAEHSCALLADRTIRCWGDNGSGQLGDGTSVQQNTSVAVPGLSDVASISAGGDATCAVTNSGTAKCWGRNEYGQLGDGTTTDRSTPTAVTGLSGVVTISVSALGNFATSGAFACAVLANGTAKCWGYNSTGQVGDGTTTLLPRTTPTSVAGLGTVVALTTGGGHACALLADTTTVKCWGRNVSGQLGDGTTTDRNTPVLTAGGFSTGSEVVALSAGNDATCVALKDGRTGCWGDRISGQIGDGSSATGAQTSPTPTAGALGASVVVAGANHTCTVAFVSQTACWGSNSNGQVGDGTTTNRATPTVVNVTGTVALAAGNLHTCALRFDGTVRCWGDGAFGQLGNSLLDQSTPTPVFAIGSTAVGITAGAFHTCALLADGTAKCWGDNEFGQLGDGTTTDRLAPVTVSGLTGAVSISAGENHTCAVLLTGTAKCWGTGNAVGTGSTLTQSTPQTAAGLSGAFALDAGGFHSCAVVATDTAFGGVRCWGFNVNGQVGDGSIIARSTPVDSSGLENVNALSGGGNHTCAVLESSEVSCWGDNAWGQVGDGTTTQRNTPTPIPSYAAVVAVAAGDEHTCAIQSIGYLRCWGRNSSGQLGDGSTTNRSTPTGVSGLS
jgi:alpha-tubulin suppressor-like RCC1 family protein